ncbi:MAG: amidohydrolase [Clostridiales Family XIII bacterium]|jgi:aminobenzoyl-glutamate utilization protein B|nr:amidohydrolase [Clostridiales Family XIII bacterium]
MEKRKIKQDICQWIDRNSDEFNDIADYIWQEAELSMEEANSSNRLAETLETYGFTVERGVAGIDTAFIATYGSGGPVIGLNSEYDSLPGLSQEVGAKKKALIEGAPGHGCGHNLLGAAGVSAAIALKTALEANGINATLKVFGAAAEELCISKPFMAREGRFEGLDLFLDWHPWNYNRADYDTCNAYFNIKYHFKGKTSHGNAPWYGRSAFDAAMLQGHAVEMLREHIRPSEAGLDAANTINYTFSDVGPIFPNVVPDRTTAWYIGRFDRTELMAEVLERIHKCAEAAALATETTVEAEMVTATHDKIPNTILAEVMHKNLEEIGAPQFTEEEHEFARKMQREMGVSETGLDEAILPFGGGGSALCDTSEYSWFVPYATAWIAAAPPGLGWHNWVVSACAGSSIGKKALNTAAKLIASTAIDAIASPEIIENAKKELEERLSTRTYIKLIPDGLAPPLRINREAMDKYRKG